MYLNTAIIGVLALLMSCVALTHEVVSTDRAPQALGPYSQAVLAGDTLYLSGQIAIDPETGVYNTGTVEEETRRVLLNLGAVLEAVGMSHADIVSTTVYLGDISDFAGMNGVYAEFFRDKPPARATVEVARIPAGARIEISAVAVR